MSSRQAKALSRLLAGSSLEVRRTQAGAYVVQRTAQPGAREPELPEVRVQAAGEKPAEIGYQPKRATTAAKSDADLMDVPQAIVVVPPQVIPDYQPRSFQESIFGKVSGVTEQNSFCGTLDGFMMPGFGAIGVAQ